MRFIKSHLGGEISNFRKWGNQSERSKTARATTFYPVIVDKELNIVKFGDVLPPDEHPAGQMLKLEILFMSILSIQME